MTKSSTDLIGTKRSELRLYCDLLMQQVHTIKTAVQDPSNTTSGVNQAKLSEGCSLLSQTCDTFIQTLDETMSLANSTNLISMPGRDADLVNNSSLSSNTVIQRDNISQRGEKVKKLS